jgi:hypothetical protein
MPSRQFYDHHYRNNAAVRTTGGVLAPEVPRRIEDLSENQFCSGGSPRQTGR